MDQLALIIEDHPMYRDALAILVRTIFGESNVVTASSSEEALSYAKISNRFNLILLDLGLPGLNGAEAVATLQKIYQSASIVVISASDERREIDAVLRSGAKAFISKAVPSEEIAKIVRKILNSEPLESLWIIPNLDHQMMSEKNSPLLTQRQSEILVFLCKGLSNKEIGLRLGIAEITVKTHVSSIFRALGVINRTQASLAARRFGIYIEEAT